MAQQGLEVPGVQVADWQLGDDPTRGEGTSPTSSVASASKIAGPLNIGTMDVAVRPAPDISTILCAPAPVRQLVLHVARSGLLIA
jgi:hypothetical protein